MNVLSFSHFNLRAPRELPDALRDFYTQVVGLDPASNGVELNFAGEDS
jgi:hypothetical protein